MHALWQRLLIKVSAKWHILNTQYNDSLPWRRPLKQEILTRKRYPHRCCQCNGYVSCIYSSTPIYSPPFLVSSTTLSVSLPLFLSITLSLSLFLYLPPSTSVSQSISDCAWWVQWGVTDKGPTDNSLWFPSTAHTVLLLLNIGCDC